MHAETLVAAPTMLSADAAVARAEEAGLTVQRVLAFDAPTPETRRFFGRDEFAAWEVAEFDFRDQGRVRNALAEQAGGSRLAFLDADDLCSENWLVRAAPVLAEYEERGERAIVHPEMNWVFDRYHAIFPKIADDDPLFTPFCFLVANYYDALCLAPTTVYRDFPFPHRDLEHGFALEDWQWAIETMAAGVRHVVARDTIIFKRRRELSQSRQAEDRGAVTRPLEAMAVGKVGTLSRVPRRPLAPRPADAG